MDARKIIDLQALFILLVAGGLSEQLIAATPTFERQVIDAAFAGDVKGIGDIDGDGLADLVIGGRQMYVYLYPNWTKRLVATANVEFTTDMQLGDVDSDGDLDIVTADGSTGNNVLWLENPRPNSSSTWARHVIGAHSSWAHDVEIGDLDRDGKIDVVTRGQNQTNLFFQNTPISWTRRDISAVMGFGEGMGIGDVNGDGYLDLAAAGAWIRSPANPRVGSWVAYPIASYPWDTTAAVGDMNNDGRTDVLFAVQHGRGSLAWFEGPTDPVNGSWLRHVIDPNMGSHKLDLGDINKDGRLDVVAGLELAELSIYLSSGDSAFTFSKQVLSTNGLHNQRLGDIDNDGDLDIFGANYLDNPPVELWENTTSGSPPTDTTPPTVSITAPVSGSTVSGTVTVSASAADAGGVAGVQFRLDGVNLGAQDVTAPYSVAWNTATATAGNHTLTAQARDTAGNLASSTTVTVTVAAPADTTPPTVSITAPVSGSTVSGTVTVSASAADAGGVAGVQFRLDGVNLGAQDLTAPYSVAWNTATATAGNHTLTAQARDTAGNLASSTTVTVTVAAPADTTPPTVSITAPVSGSTVSGTVTVSASAADAGGVAGVQFRLDGVNLGAEDLTAPYSVAWNTVTATAGNHTLTAQARDTAGNLASSTTVTVTVAMLPGGGGGVTSNLIGHWRLDDGAGITAQDAAGSYPGSLRNGPLWVPGKSGQALSFDGADDFVDLGILNVSGSALTIAAWIKADSFADEARIVSRAVGSAEQDHYFMLSTVDNGGIKLRFRLKTGTTTSTLLASTGTLAVGQWIHVAAVYDGSAMVLYKDGLEVGRLAKTGVLATDATARAAIGRNPQPYAPFDGTIDDVRVYARALTPAAIGELIELASLPPPDTTPPTVSITAPVSGSTVSGTVTVSASAADAGGVAGVQFRLDGVNLGAQDLTAPYSVAWNTATATAGNHTLTAQARDTAGNLASSTTVTVTVAAPADTTPPTVSITAPVSGSTVSGTVTVSASAADAGGVAGVQFRLDGVNLGAQDVDGPVLGGVEHGHRDRGQSHAHGTGARHGGQPRLINHRHGDGRDAPGRWRWRYEQSHWPLEARRRSRNHGAGRRRQLPGIAAERAALGARQVGPGTLVRRRR